ncbi:MAG: cytochrome P450 [Hyphomonadaceae bacterium]|nr:cytochrome P450 [Hyphomonadaceae bacterium]
MANAPISSDFRSFDLHAKDVRVDAELVWERMRAQPGLARSEALGGFYLISRYAELRQALVDHALFSSAQGIVVPDQGVRSMHIPAEVDPPAQRAYRAIMARHFTPDRVAKMAPRIRRIVTSLLDRITGETHVDFVDAFARPLPVHVSLALLGLPEGDAQRLDALVVALHEEVATGVRQGGADQLTAYVRDTLLARAPKVSSDDDTLVSDIICGAVDGRPLTLEEQVSMVRLILVGGFDSTAIALTTAVWWLAQRPEDLERLRAEPSLIDAFNEDVVRFASPATYLRRTVSRDVTFGGQDLAAGDRVVLAFGAANRDPAEFECPSQIRLDRKPNNHLGFGFGAHRCIGSWVAKAEMKIAIEEVLARYAGISLDPDQGVMMSSGLNQGIVRLPIILKPKGG